MQLLPGREGGSLVCFGTMCLSFSFGVSVLCSAIVLQVVWLVSSKVIATEPSGT